MVEQKRRFSTRKAYKLAKTLIIIVSALLLIIGSMRALNSQNHSQYYIQQYNEECKNKERPSYLVDLCIYYLNEPRQFDEDTFKVIGLGMAIPGVFFGFSWLFNYLLPRKEEEN